MKFVPILPITLIGFFLCGMALATSFEFTPTVADLGTLRQGQKVPVTLKGIYKGKQPLKLETVLSQNIGSDNFRYPTSLRPGQRFEISFDFSSAYLGGLIEHTIVMVEEGGKPHVTHFRAHIQVPIQFSQGILDLGYHQQGAQTEWNFYAWNRLDGKPFQLELSPEASKRYRATLSPVNLDVSDPETPVEGGKVAGFRIKLQVVDLGSGPRGPQRSIRDLVTWKSSTWPEATPEQMTVGFWK